MNRKYKSIAFMGAINPLLSDGTISNDEAAYLIDAFKDSKDSLIRAFITTTHISKATERDILSLLPQEE